MKTWLETTPLRKGNSEMTSFGFFVVAFVAGLVIRGSELWVHTKHVRWMLAQGGKGHKSRRFLFFFAASMLLPVIALIEYAMQWNPRLPFVLELGLGFVLSGLLLRLWSMRTLGPFWTIGNVKVPGYDKRLNIGPYRWFARPEMWGWLLEAAGLCLILSAPISTVINIIILLTLIGFCQSATGDFADRSEFSFMDVISKS